MCVGCVYIYFVCVCVHIFLNEYRGENIGNEGPPFLFLMEIFSNMQLRENRMKQFFYDL